MPLLDFSDARTVKYAIRCVNNSTANWYFYLFQKMKNQSVDSIYSLVWLSSPYKLARSSTITFVWTANFSFEWIGVGKIVPDKVYPMSGTEIAHIRTASKTSFNIVNQTPIFSKASKGPGHEIFTIDVKGNVPNNSFATGIGMSGQPTFVKASMPNTTQKINAKSEYVLGAATEIRMGQLLPFTHISNTIEFHFPTNVYHLEAVLGENNLWKVEQPTLHNIENKKNEYK